MVRMESPLTFFATAGSLIVDTCNRNTMYDTQLWVGTGERYEFERTY